MLSDLLIGYTVSRRNYEKDFFCYIIFIIGWM